jgi:hypothetical protein
MPIRPVYQNVCRPLLCCLAIRSPGNCKLSQFVPPAVTHEKKTHYCSLFGISSGHSPFSKQYQYSIAISNVSDLYSEDMQFESLPEHEPFWLIFHGFRQPLQVNAWVPLISFSSCIFNSSFVNHPVIILCMLVCAWVRACMCVCTAIEVLVKCGIK